LLRWWSNLLLTRYEKRLKGRVYESISDLPIHNWEQIHEKNDLSFLLIDKLRFKVGPAAVILPTIWAKIYDEYISTFGFGDNFLMINRKRNRITQMIAQMISTGDRSMMTFINIENIELAQMEKASEAQKNHFVINKGHLEKQLGFPVNPHTTSVKQYYSYFITLKQANN